MEKLQAQDLSDPLKILDSDGIEREFGKNWGVLGEYVNGLAPLTKYIMWCDIAGKTDYGIDALERVCTVLEILARDHGIPVELSDGTTIYHKISLIRSDISILKLDVGQTYVARFVEADGSSRSYGHMALCYLESDLSMLHSSKATTTTPDFEHPDATAGVALYTPTVAIRGKWSPVRNILMPDTTTGEMYSVYVQDGELKKTKIAS